MDHLKLTATPLSARLDHSSDAEPIVVRLTTSPAEATCSNHALLVRSDERAYLVAGRADPYRLPKDLAYLEDGDIVRVNPRGAEVWVMYRRSSKSNSLLLTERCNSWCIMCSQPPKQKDDDALVGAWLDAIPLMSAETEELGFTGGEPTLLRDQFCNIVGACREHLPATNLHVLSNGRMFNYLSFAQKLTAINHPGLVIGIPIYSDLAWQHDFIVQAQNAFDQTIRGTLNLARCGIRVEVRVVIHRHSVARLSKLATFIARNLPFVEHVALMGLEPIGFAKSNLEVLWVDPVDYQEQLDASVQILHDHGMNVSIYNHQLCVLPAQLWPFARQSISDWKNVYLPVCESCAVRNRCGGFFHSATRAHSRSITPLTAT